MKRLLLNILIIIMVANVQIKDVLSIDWKKENAKDFHLDFMQYTWQKSDPFIVGRHTTQICDLIDNAIIQYQKGISTFLIVTIPYRHGKTDIISRYLPAHFLGQFPDDEVLVTTYGQDLSNDLSRDCRSILKSDIYREVYPEIEISQESHSVAHWEIKNRFGSSNWVGVGGAMTGKGYHLGIIDDYLKNRDDAESLSIRERQWSWFTDVFMTRRAPISITIMLATRWHMDDLIGRVIVQMRKDEDFPKFELVKIPAESEDYPKRYLFLERFPESWYIGQKATLGDYGVASLLQCDPTQRGGNLLKTGKIQIIEEDQFPEDLLWVRAWDLASSEAERIKTDPDYTVGTLMAVKYIYREDINEKIPHLYIKHMIRLRSEAPERNNVIKNTALSDGEYVKVGVETVGGYKDAYTQMKDILMGIRTVQNINVGRDKVVRATPLEVIFEAGNVFYLVGDWNRYFIDEVSSFPSGTHDDVVDSIVCGYEMLKKGIDFDDLPAIRSKKKEGINI